MITPSEEIKQMLKFLAEEEDRAKYYIHDPKSKYLFTIRLNEIHTNPIRKINLT